MADRLAVAASKCLRLACERHFPAAKLGSVAAVVSGGTPPTNDSTMWSGDIVWVTPKDLGRPRHIEICDSERRISPAGIPGRRLLPADTVLLSSRAPIGHVAIAGVDLCTNQGFKNIVCSSALDNRYLFHILRASVEELEAQGRGNTFKEIPSRVVLDLSVPLAPLDCQKAVARFLDAFYLRLAGQADALPALPPPLEEQRRIVSRIEELAVKAEAAVALRRAAIEGLSVVWQSALFHEFVKPSVRSPTPGDAAELLKRQAEKWPSAGESKHNNAHPHRPTVHSDGPWHLLPGWIWTNLGSVVTHLVDCVNDTPEFAEEPTGFIGLKSTNVRPYSLDLTVRWYVTPSDFARWNRREKPVEGDLLLTREAPMGNVCLLEGRHEVCLTQRLMLLRTDDSFVRRRYLLHFLNSPHFTNQILERSRGLTTPHIRVQDAPGFTVPLAPLFEQDGIVARLDAIQGKVVRCGRLQERTNAELTALVPSILDKAFKGEL